MQWKQSHEPHKLIDQERSESEDSSDNEKDDKNQLITSEVEKPIAIVGSAYSSGVNKRTSNRELNKDVWKWGVNMFSSSYIGNTKVKISIQDVHLIFQICSFASDSIMTDGIMKLQDINDGLR